MTDWSLSKVLSSLHDEIERKLDTARKTFGHSTTLGDASESIWLELFQEYLPQRYQAACGHVVDSLGVFSDQIDVIIFDRQYSPFIFKFQGKMIVPAESVYAVFEAKQVLNLKHINYAQTKVGTVRTLHRTSLPIPHAGGVYPAKGLIPIIGGILTLDSDWSPKFGDSLASALDAGVGDQKLDMGCVASHGCFYFNEDKKIYETFEGNKPATAFLFKLISRLQFSGTVPMIDIQAYGNWLLKQLI